MALSIAAHAVVLTAVALHAPTLFRPYEDPGPPEPVIPVLIMPRVPPAPPGSSEKPQPIRLHRRQLRRDQPPPDVEPFVPPVSLPEPRPAPTRPVAQPRVSVQPSPAAQLSAVLRGGRVGCANPSLLTAAEREKCQEMFGRGAAEAPRIGPLADPAFERAAAARENNRRYRDGNVPSGVTDPTGGSGSSNRNKPLDLPPLGPLRP
ncbi:hypothetical protein LJR225_000124 [Phenylobacterium sp. LjRoot225]|uniref:hypothetical protein n=1 Tax=Phenylobacterium sp. LjRoot225 TaxID=3342285 RepID=UPI003ED01034